MAPCPSGGRLGWGPTARKSTQWGRKRASAHLRRHRGFSLLEVVVAFAIAALSLGLLYQVMGSNARQTGDLSQRERAMVLAESLLAAHETVPPEGLDEADQAAGYGWHVSSRPYPTPADNAPQAPHLHEVLVSVNWLDGDDARTFELTSLRPERRPLQGAPK